MYGYHKLHFVSSYSGILSPHEAPEGICRLENITEGSVNIVVISKWVKFWVNCPFNDPHVVVAPWLFCLALTLPTCCDVFPSKGRTECFPQCLYLLMHLSRSSVRGGAPYLPHKLSFHGSSVSFRHSAFHSHSMNYINRNLAEFPSTLSSLDGREREWNKR